MSESGVELFAGGAEFALPVSQLELWHLRGFLRVTAGGEQLVSEALADPLCQDLQLLSDLRLLEFDFLFLGFKSLLILL